VPRVLPRRFYARPADVVAPELLGCVVESVTPEGLVAVRLTEVEAYAGQDDPASHAWRGPTPRTAVMFGEPGHVYVYFTYGMHWCANLVCATDGVAAAALLRAGEDIGGPSLLARYAAQRGVDRDGVVQFTDRLVRGFSDAGSGRAALRNLGLLVFDLLPPAKRALSRISFGFGGKSPRLTRGLPL